jgi:DegV family protein with EDD domain
LGIDYVDGRRYARAVVAGADWVLHTRESLDRINVFPVPDGDTGTNMALSLDATAAAVRASGERHLGRVARKVAEASILGAKGNSGLILAHWFLGVSRSVGGQARIESRGLADALHAGALSVRDALEHPVEGTILTVMRSAAERALGAVHHGAGVAHLLDDVLSAAEAALARTPEMLEPLRKAGVVDAGAAGWVNFLKGVRRAIRGEPPPERAPDDLAAAVTHPPDFDASGERYCTELICRGRDFDEAKLRRRFAGDGTHLLVATTGSVFKLHIHTDHPDAVFRKAERLGRVEERKVDDMRRQSEERRAGFRGPDGGGEPPSGVAVVCDSTADLPAELRDRHGIAMVPLQVLFGDSVYRDQVDLASEEFYRRLSRGERATTSQPPPRAFVEALERIRGDRPVVVLTLSAALSGTFRSARSGAALAAQPRVDVIDSRSASLGLGLLALGAARLAERGADSATVVGWIERWRAGTGIAFTVRTLEHLRRGGRIGPAAELLGNLLGLRPVLAYEGDGVRAEARARGDDDAFAKVLAAVARRVPEGSRARFGIVQADRPREAARAEEAIRARWDAVDLVHAGFTGVVGAHTGPGTWGIAWQRVPDDDPLAPA